MSGQNKYLKAKSLLDQDKIKLTYANFSSDRPFLSFEIENVLVQYNHKGWSSDWVESDDEYIRRCAKAKREGKEIPMRWSSAYLTKSEDCYILACKMWLRRTALPKLSKLTNDIYRQIDIIRVLEASLQAISFGTKKELMK